LLESGIIIPSSVGVRALKIKRYRRVADDNTRVKAE